MSTSRLVRFTGSSIDSILHLELGVKPREVGEVRHEQMCREGRRQHHPQRSAYALVATEDAGLQLVRRRFHRLRERGDLLPRISQTIARRQLLEHARPEALL